MGHDDQDQACARRAQSAGFLFGVREASHRRGVPRNQPKLSILVQQDQDRQDGRKEVITTREKPSSSAGFGPLNRAGTGANNKALQLTYSSSACCPTLLLYMHSCSAL